MDYDDGDSSTGTSKRLGKKHLGLSMGIVRRDLTIKGRNVLSRKTQEKPLDITNPNRFDGEGVIYRGKLIGVLEVNGPRGDPICQEALSELKVAVRAAGEHKQRILICIGMDGIRLRDERTGDCLYHHPVHKISFIAQDMTDARAFGYIFGSPDQGHRFFGIKTERAASAIVMAMRDLFQVVFDLKKKEIEQAKRLADETKLSNGTSSRRAESVSSTSGLMRDRSSHSVITADLLDLESELCSLQEGLHQMGSLTNFKSVDDPMVGASTDVLYDPFGDSFSGSSKRSSSSSRHPDVVPSISSVHSGKKSPASVSPLPPPVSKFSRTLPRKDKQLESRRREPSPQGFVPKFDVNFPDPFDDGAVEFGDGRLFRSLGHDPFSDSVADRSPSSKKNEVKNDVRETKVTNGPAPVVTGEDVEKRESTKDVGEPQVAVSTIGDVFSDLDPLGSGKNRPYVDKKDFFQDLKQMPKKPALREIPTTDEPTVFDTPSKQSISTKLSDDSGSFFDTPDWKPTEFAAEAVDPFGSLNFVPPERDPFDTQLPLFGAPPKVIQTDVFSGRSETSVSPTFGAFEVASKSPQLRRVVSTDVKVGSPARDDNPLSRQRTLDIPLSGRGSDWSGSESSLQGTPPLPPFPKSKTTPQKPTVGLSRILSQEFLSGSDSESRLEVGAPQPPPRPAAAQPPPLPPKRVAAPSYSYRSSGSTRADSDDDWVNEETPPLPAPSRRPRSRDVFTESKTSKEAPSQPRSLDSVSLAQLSTMSISDLAATLRLPPAKLTAMTLTELALRLSELTADEEARERREHNKAIESFIASSKQEEPRKFSATERYQILGDSFEDDIKTEQHEPTVVSFRTESPPPTEETQSPLKSSFSDEFGAKTDVFNADFESHFSEVEPPNSEQQFSQSDRYAALREIFAAEGLVSEEEPAGPQNDSSESSIQEEEFKGKPSTDSTTNLFDDSFEPKWDNFQRRESKQEEKPETPHFEDFANRFPPASAFEDEEVSFLNRFSTNRQSDSESSVKLKSSVPERLSVKTVSVSASPSPFEDDFVLENANRRDSNASSDFPVRHLSRNGSGRGPSQSSSVLPNESFSRSLSVASNDKLSGFESNFTKIDESSAGFGDSFISSPATKETKGDDKFEQTSAKVEVQADFSKGFGDDFAADFSKAFVESEEVSASLPKSASVNIFEESADPFDDDFFQKPSVSRISEDFPDDFTITNV